MFVYNTRDARPLNGTEMRARAPPLIFLALLSLAGASAPPRFVLRLLAELPDGRGTGLCGATLLGPREALTAAHCVFFGGAASPFVLVRHPETGFYSRATARAARAPAGDLALLRLSRAFAETPARVAPAPPRTGARGYFFGLAPPVAALRPGGAGGAFSLLRRDDVNYTCRGDSGTPLLDGRGRVAGALSRGERVCGEGGALRYAETAGAWPRAAPAASGARARPWGLGLFALSAALAL